MKALILNSGRGTRIGSEQSGYPKGMTRLTDGTTILQRQLELLYSAGIEQAVITTGLYADVLRDYADGLGIGIGLSYVHNPKYEKTNYIYSIYLARSQLDGDILLLHGDIIFSPEVLQQILQQEQSCMAVSRTAPLPEKDFKAVLDGDRIRRIGISVYESAVAAQPLYCLYWEDWKVWLHEIEAFCDAGRTDCYAEEAFNEAADKCKLYAQDVGDQMCMEIDCYRDLEVADQWMNR